LQLKVALYKNLHARVLQFVANTGLLDEASFEVKYLLSCMHMNMLICYLMSQEFYPQLLDKIYVELARIWMEMKFQAKTKADNLPGLYKFRSRDFKIDSVMEVDISALGKYFPNESFSEWQEYLADDDTKNVKDMVNPSVLWSTGTCEFSSLLLMISVSSPQTHIDQDEENLEDDWDLIQEHLDSIYSTHNELFGFCDLSEKVLELKSAIVASGSLSILLYLTRQFILFSLEDSVLLTVEDWIRSLIPMNLESV